jgi:hypothetical protein
MGNKRKELMARNIDLRTGMYQELRNELAVTVQELKHDIRHYTMSDADIQFDMGRIAGLRFAIMLQINVQDFYDVKGEEKRLNKFYGRVSKMLEPYQP